MTTPAPGWMPYPPTKKRPGGWWFGVGALLVVAAIALCVLTLARFAHTLVHTDASFWDSGRHRVELPAHQRRGLYIPGPRARHTCRILDDSGAPVPLSHPHGRLVVNGFGLRATFDTGDGHLTVVCHGFGAISEARIGSVPTRGDVVRLALLGFVAPAVLGLVGLLVLVLTAALWFSRRPPVLPPRGPPGPGIPPPPRPF